MAAAREKTAVVLGARGTLGLALCEQLPLGGWSIAAAVARNECDIRDEAALRALFDRTRPTAVFNAAAYTDVDRAELEPEVAFAVNEAGARSVAARPQPRARPWSTTRPTSSSTASRPALTTKTNPPTPQGSYARSKVAGDAAVADRSARHFILRVGCLYGRGGRNFPSTIVRRLRKGETIRADCERLGSPTWVREVARVSAALAATESYGLYHCTSHGETTWADFARLAAELLGLPASKVEGVPTAALPMKAPRPRRAILDNRMLRQTGLDTLSTWQDALRAFAAEEMRLE